MPGPSEERREERAAWAMALAALAVLIGLAVVERVRWMDLVVAGEAPEAPARLSGDAAQFRDLAVARPLPCFDPTRPPLFPALGRTALLLFGTTEPAGESDDRANEFVLRRLSIAFSVLSLLALWVLTLQLGGRFAATVAAFLWATFETDVYYSVGFLRVDLVIAFHLGLISALVALDGAEGRRRRLALVATAACLAALAGATRLSSLLVVALLTAAWLASRLVFCRLGRRDLVVAAAVNLTAWLVVAPYLVDNARTVGDPFRPMAIHARFWRNHEFAGQPGFPSRAEVVADSYAGPETSGREYVFGLRSPGEVVARYADGYRVAWFEFLPRMMSRWPGLVWLVGPGALLLCLRRRGPGLFAVATAFACLFPFAFVLPLDVVLTVEVPEVGPGVEPRFAMPIAPHAILWVAVVAGGVADGLGRLGRARLGR